MFKVINFLLLIAFSVFTSISAFAVEYDLKGFITQGFVQSNNTALFDKKSNTSWALTHVALKGGIQFTPKLSVSTQILYRNFGDYAKEGVTIEHLMASYHFVDTASLSSGIHLGRIIPEIGLYNATRDLPWTRPSIFMPQSIYPDVLRDGYFSYDGVSYFHNIRLNDSLIQLNFLRGKPNYSDNTVNIYIGEKANSKVQAEWANAFSAKWYYDSSWVFMFTHFYNEMSAEQEYIKNSKQKRSTRPLIEYSDAFTKYDQNLFSIQYSAEQFEFTSEYIQADYTIHGGLPKKLEKDPVIGPYILGYERTKETFYIQARYRLNDKFNLTSRVDVTFKNIDDRYGKRFEANMSEIAKLAQQRGFNYIKSQPSYSAYAKSIMASLQYSISPQWMLSVEGHYGEGLAWTPAYYNIFERRIDNKYWSLYAAEIAFRF